MISNIETIYILWFWKKPKMSTSTLIHTVCRWVRNLRSIFFRVYLNLKHSGYDGGPCKSHFSFQMGMLPLQIAEDSFIQTNNIPLRNLIKFCFWLFLFTLEFIKKMKSSSKPKVNFGLLNLNLTFTIRCERFLFASVLLLSYPRQ